VNQALIRRAIESRFATIFHGMLFPDGRLTYCNAGHNPPLLMTKQGFRRLEKGGLIVGLFEHATFEDESLQLEPGDYIVVFSDGVTEALNLAGEEFTEERLLKCIDQHTGDDPTHLLAAVLSDVKKFAAGATQSDDVTAMVLRYAV
jgi:sigma-B regulation protein RsbU (phosphoserine phosphatase)